MSRKRNPTLKDLMSVKVTFEIQILFLKLFFPTLGLDASPPASTHELTIPNDVSTVGEMSENLRKYIWKNSRVSKCVLIHLDLKDD